MWRNSRFDYIFFGIWMVNFIIEEMNNAIVSKIYYEIL